MSRRNNCTIFILTFTLFLTQSVFAQYEPAFGTAASTASAISNFSTRTTTMTATSPTNFKTQVNEATQKKHNDFEERLKQRLSQSGGGKPLFTGQPAPAASTSTSSTPSTTVTQPQSQGYTGFQGTSGGSSGGWNINY